MANLLIVFTLCVVAFVAANEEDHEYGRYGEWRKTICEKQNRTIHEDTDVCFQTEPKAVLDATKDCVNECAPSAGGSVVEFLEVACVDKSIFKKFDKCMEEYEANAAYRKQMDVSNDTIACYEAVLEKYGLHELKPILEEEAASQAAAQAAAAAE